MERPGATTLRGNPKTLIGPELKAGDAAPDFSVVDNALNPVTLKDTGNKVRIISVIPSLDTPVCDAQTKKFNEEVANLPGVDVLTVSMDLPFAQKRWCAAAGVSNVKTLSDFRDRAFGPAYGVELQDSPLAGLTARAVFVVGKDGKVTYAEYVSDITKEPNYDAALGAARTAAST